MTIPIVIVRLDITTITGPDLVRTAPYTDMKKIGQFLGILSTSGALILWIVYIWFNPYFPSHLTLPMVAMMALALVGFVAASLKRPLVMLLIFGFSFFPVGFYMLNSPGIFKWIGIFNLLYGQFLYIFYMPLQKFLYCFHSFIFKLGRTLSYPYREVVKLRYISY